MSILPETAIGFRVKSGWAAAVLLAGPADAPRLVDCRVVQLADPEIPESVQPYHVGLDRPGAKGKEAVRSLVGTVEQFAERSVTELITRYRDAGHRIRGVGIVTGSNADPASIKNDHIRAHAEEGRLFRRVIEEPARRCGLESLVVVEKALYTKASNALQIAEARLKERVTALGKGFGGPWRAEQKMATLAAWIVLAGARAKSPGRVTVEP